MEQPTGSFWDFPKNIENILSWKAMPIDGAIKLGDHSTLIYALLPLWRPSQAVQLEICYLKIQKDIRLFEFKSHNEYMINE